MILIEEELWKWVIFLLVWLELLVCVSFSSLFLHQFFLGLEFGFPSVEI
jgi:uncharacterized membrane protein YoaK (UPF0700 family)